jgi:hypothetical protein
MQMRTAALFVAGLALVAAGIAGSGRTGTPRAPGPAVQPPGGILAVQHTRVFDGEAVLPRATVIVRDGIIEAVGQDVRVPTGAMVIDGAGKTLIPGLVDAHVHTFGDALDRALVFLFFLVV